MRVPPPPFECPFPWAEVNAQGGLSSCPRGLPSGVFGLLHIKCTLASGGQNVDHRLGPLCPGVCCPHGLAILGCHILAVESCISGLPLQNGCHTLGYNFRLHGLITLGMILASLILKSIAFSWFPAAAEFWGVLQCPPIPSVGGVVLKY